MKMEQIRRKESSEAKKMRESAGDNDFDGGGIKEGEGWCKE